MREQRQGQCVRRDAYSTCRQKKITVIITVISFCVRAGVCACAWAWADPSMENENWERSNEKYSLYAFNEH